MPSVPLSCVSLSNLCRLSSTSVFPTSFLEIFFCTDVSAKSRTINPHSIDDSLNRPRFCFLRRDSKDGEYLNHNIQRLCPSLAVVGVIPGGVDLKPLEKSFDAVKELEKLVSASVDIFSRLRVRVLE